VLSIWHISASGFCSWDTGIRMWSSFYLLSLLPITSRYFSRSKYQKVRRTIAIDNFLAFAVLTAYRCTPPRLMPESYGFVDVLHPLDEGGPNFWASNPFQLTLAAMPSLHFGTSLLIGLSLVFCGKHLLVRIIAPLYPVAMFFAVLGTANHWILDCVVGVLVVGVGW
jgi:hypothetical protein